jgi:tetratricopeptide (TPR) repeat protein
VTRRHGLLLLWVLFALAAPRAWAVKEWYDYYSEGKASMQQGKYREALASFHEAVRLKPGSEANARSYGMEFVPYFPYYQMGLCYLKLGDSPKAMASFDREDSNGAIRQRSDDFADLRRQRDEARNAEAVRVARLVRADVDRLEREAGELAGGKRYDDALARIAQALSAATAGQLDVIAQKRLTDLRERIRQEQKTVTEAADKTRQIEQALADGRRLLDEGKPAEATVQFDRVLSNLDPGNRRAADGRKEAQDKLRASTAQQQFEQNFQEGQRLLEAGRYEEAITPLTVAAADPGNAAAREALAKASRVVENVRQQKELRAQSERLFQDAQALFAAAKFSEAQVKLDTLLRIDAGNVKAAELLNRAMIKSGEAMIRAFFPNRPPTLTLAEPRGNDLTVDTPTLPLFGVATDDQGLARVEFFVDGSSVATRRVPPGEAGANFGFDENLPLHAGVNVVTIVATDSGDLKQTETLRVTRRLRFYETPAFLPASLAGALSLLGIGFGGQRWRRRRAVRTRFNPYIAGAPVMSDELFFGREKLLARILNVLHHNSLMITGERRIGKTSFLYHLKKALELDEGTEYKFFPVSTDLQGVSEEDFFHSLMSDVVEALRPRPEPLRFRREELRYDGRDFSHDLQRVIEELKLRTPKKVKLALLIDEVDVLNEFSERINQRLRSIFMKTFSENLVAIMSGVGIRRIWNSEGSPWYNFFDEVELTAFTRDDAVALITTPVDGIFRYEPKAVEAILEWSDLKPYLIQRFCIYAVNRIIEERRLTVTAADVAAVRESVLAEAPAARSQDAPLRRQASA